MLHLISIFGIGISISMVLLTGCQRADGTSMQQVSHESQENGTGGISPHIRVHAVARGQTLADIADLYGVRLEEIARRNLLEGEFIIAGQQLIIPPADEVLPTSNTEPDARNSIPLETRPPMLLKPCSRACVVTQLYSADHHGIDLQTRGGGPIFAAADGTVVYSEAGWNHGYGMMIEISHGNGFSTRYGHNRDLYLKKGDSVTAGQVIGFMGNSGNVHGETGIHLHFEVRINGQARNPLLYFADIP